MSTQGDAKGLELFRNPFSKRSRSPRSPRFAVGAQVILARDLPTQRAGSIGQIRGLTPTPEGVNYAIRFDHGMRIVAEQDLDAHTDSTASPSQ